MPYVHLASPGAKHVCPNSAACWSPIAAPMGTPGSTSVISPSTPEEGTIRGVHARIDPEKVGRGSLVIVGVVLDRSTPESFAAFEAAASAMPMLLDCHLVAGDFDYFLKIRVRDMADFNRLHSSTLLTLPGVRQTRTFFVMKEVLDNAPMTI